jgi:DNA-binding Lrp family transcriptional regulator
VPKINYFPKQILSIDMLHITFEFSPNFFKWAQINPIENITKKIAYVPQILKPHYKTKLWSLIFKIKYINFLVIKTFLKKNWIITNIQMEVAMTNYKLQVIIRKTKTNSLKS